jgi:hypothetical protein
MAEWYVRPRVYINVWSTVYEYIPLENEHKVAKGK